MSTANLLSQNFDDSEEEDDFNPQPANDSGNEGSDDAGAQIRNEDARRRVDDESEDEASPAPKRRERTPDDEEEQDAEGEGEDTAPRADDDEEEDEEDDDEEEEEITVSLYSTRRALLSFGSLLPEADS